MTPQDAFVHACEWDVAVRKPGNVSWASPGHGMAAPLFLASAQAAAGPLFASNARVGQRIEASVQATWAVAQCNTNLGILLLCAPLAMALENLTEPICSSSWQAAVEDVLDHLNDDDTRAVFRAIAQANPGGLGRVPTADVNEPPSMGLRAAMALAADRDLIARQYRDGYALLFEWVAHLPKLALMKGPQLHGAPPTALVQSLFLSIAGSHLDSHILRKHGLAVAQQVMHTAGQWFTRTQSGQCSDSSPEFAAWDESLKAQRINPGTSADLTVATLMMGLMLGVVRA